jgi:hypothetical protein
LVTAILIGRREHPLFLLLIAAQRDAGFRRAFQRNEENKVLL